MESDTRGGLSSKNDDGASKKLVGNSKQGSVVEAPIISSLGLLVLLDHLAILKSNFLAYGKFSSLTAIFSVC